MTSLYVSPNGSDSNNGSQSAPFATIAAASAAATSGDTVIVQPGTYAGGFQTSANGVTYESATPGGAVIDYTGSGGTVWTDTGSNVTIKGFDITGPDADIGMYVTGASNVTVQGNTIHDILNIASSSAYQNAISSQNGGGGLEADDWGSGGYHTGGGNDTFNGNLVYNVGPSGTTDSLIQGIYIIADGSTVENNIVYNVAGGGIQDWHGGSNQKIVNNTVYNTRDGGFVEGADPGNGGTASGNILANNIFANDGSMAFGEEGQTGTNTFTDNLVYNDGSSPVQLQNGDTGTGTITGNPDFVNAAGNDFQLQSGSPAIGAGTTTNAPSTDFAGNARTAPITIGAYQYGSSSGGGGGTNPETLAIANISSQTENTAFTVSGTISNASGTPNLEYENDQGGFLPLPAGAAVSGTSFSFQDSGIATTGNHTVTVEDANDTSATATSNSFAVSAPTGGGTTITIPQPTYSATENVSGDTIVATSGNHLVYIGGSNNTVSLTGGFDRLIETSGGNNTLIIPPAHDGTLMVRDGVLTDGDKFDLRQVLQAAGWDGNTSDIGNYLTTFETSQGYTDLQVKASHAGGTASVVAAITGTHTDLANIVAHSIT